MASLRLMKVLNLALLALVFAGGLGSIHHHLHCDAVKSSPTHNPETCPDCQHLKILSADLLSDSDCRSLLVDENVAATGSLESFLISNIPVLFTPIRSPPLS